MVSEKMKDLVKNGSVIRAMFEEGIKMAAAYGAENVYDFSLGNPSVAPPASVKKAAIELLNNVPETILHGYMPNSGYSDVREKTAQSLNRKFSTNYGVENIVMTSGAAGAMNVIFKTILNPGDEVIVFAPFFGEYINYIKNFDCKPVIVAPTFDKDGISSFGLNISAIENLINGKTKAVIINSPNNPTGAVYGKDELASLAAVLEEKQRQFGTDIYLISDEPYRQIVYGNIEVPFVPSIYKNTFVAYSYSKSLSLPGERIGYIVTPSELADFDNITQALNVANRILGFVNAPSLFQKVAAECVDEVCDMTVYIKNKEVLYKELTAMGYVMNEPQGAFYMFPKCFIADDKAFCAKAKEFRLLVVPGSSFACPGYFRIAFCQSHETVLKSLDSFKQLAKAF